MPKVAEELHSRPPLQRMMLIHDRINAGDFPNCSLLAKTIEVTTRTILRDVEFMKCRLNLPIGYDTSRRGYSYTHPVHHFPLLELAEADVFALLVAHKAIAQYHGTPFEAPLRVAFKKLTDRLDQSRALSVGNLSQALSFHPFAADEADLESFQILSQALQEQRMVQLLYKNLGADKAQMRRVHPYHVACVDNRWYLIAYDPARKGMRNFSLTRMRDLKLLPEKFALPKDFQIDAYLKNSFGIFQGTEDFDVVVEFDKWSAELVRERKWHHSQAVIDLPGGGLRLRLRLSSLAEVERWVLSWGTHATVVAPVALGERLQRTAEILASRYTPCSGTATLSEAGATPRAGLNEAEYQKPRSPSR